MASKNLRSPAWEHFKYNVVDGSTDKTITVCQLCAANIKHSSGSTSSMGNHLKRKHGIDVTVQKASSTKSNIVGRDGKGDTSSVRKQMSKSGQLSISDAFLIKNKLSQSSPRHISITRSIAVFMAKDMRPFSVVENEGFKLMISSLEPRYHIPSRRHFSETVLPKLYDETSKKVVDDLKIAEFLAVTTDSWTSRATQSYNTVTVHYVEDWNMKSHVLQTRIMEESHTGQHLAEMLEKTVQEWQLKRNDQMPALTTDNARNIMNAGKIAGFNPHIRCVAHTVNLATQRGLKVPEMDRLCGKIRRVVTFFHKSTTAMAILSNKQRILEIPVHKLIHDVPTRWNSTYDMIERFVEQSPAIEATVQMQEMKRNAKDIYTLTDDDVSDAGLVLKILEPIKTVTTLLCSEKTPTLSLIHPLKEMLLSQLCISDKDSHLTAAVKTAFCEDLAQRYTDPDILSVLLQSSFLDPRFKAMPYISDVQRVEVYGALTTAAVAVNKLVQDNVRVKLEPDINPAATNGDPPLPVLEVPIQESSHSVVAGPSSVSETCPEVKLEPPAKKPKHALEDLFGEVFVTGVEPARPLETRIDQEILGYKADSAMPLNTDPLQWWRKHEKKYPLLAALARKFFCIPATSVASERVFSTAGDLVSAQRACLLPEQIDRLIFLHKNYDY